MKIRVARTAGFCMGVRRALDVVFDAARHRAAPPRPGGRGPDDGPPGGGAAGKPGRPPLATLGPLIHNRQALEALRARGIRVAARLSEVEGRAVVIRAHGAGPTLRGEIASKGLSVIDATCPRVVRCQRAVERAAAEGRQIVIAGDADHAEVRALVDFAGGSAVVISSPEEAGKIALRPPVTLLAQTTFNASTFDEIAAVLAGRAGGDAVPSSSAADGTETGERSGEASAKGAAGIEVVRTLCRSTEERQRETAALAREADAVVVVGGRESANTKRLAEVASSCGVPAFHVETADELEPSEFDGFGSVAVTAGASTPAWVTERVVERLSAMRSPARRAMRSLADALVGTNVLLALGASSVAFAAAFVTGEPRADCVFIAFAYVFSAYAANRAGGAATGTVGASARGAFFDRHRALILSAAGVFSAAALALAFLVGPWTFAALLGADLVAAIYSLRILPARLESWGLSRFRDIPGSKDVLVALAWAFVAVGLPLTTAIGAEVRWLEVALAAGGVFLLSLSAATALALGDVQSDRLVGNESVAVLLGLAPARALAAAGAGAVAAGAVALAAARLTSAASVGFAFAGAIIFLATMRPRRPGDSLALELAIQTALLAAGPIALLAVHAPRYV